MGGSGRAVMGRVWVFQMRGPVFDSRRIMVVSGRAIQPKLLLCHISVSLKSRTDTQNKKPRFLTKH